MEAPDSTLAARRLAFGAVTLAALALAAVHAGCASDPADPDSAAKSVAVEAAASADSIRPMPVVASAPRRARTDRGRFDVEWTSTHPIAFNEPFDASCRVTHVSGEPADDVQVTVSAWMPAHRHGTAREPKTVHQGDGRYHVTGMLLHMDGHWEMLVDIGFQSEFDRARFDVVLAPEGSADAIAGFTADEVARVLALSPVPPLPDDPTNAHDLDERAAHLGQFLFFDPELSGSGATSCATCHVPERGWSDGKPLASAEGQLARRTMPLWNVAHQRWLFWDGRADSLWSQALQPLEDPREMAGDRVAIAHRIASDADVRVAYERIFGELPELADSARFPARAKPDPTAPDGEFARAWGAMAEDDRAAIDRVFANVGKSIAAFQRKIVSGSSPFDDFVAALREGDAASLDRYPAEARRGLALFLGRANCHFCHSGPNFTDLEFHDTRLPRNADLPLDLGRFAGVMRLQHDAFNGRGVHADGDDVEARAKLEHLVVGGQVWGEFRTPTLREVGGGGPYMHQGQFATLEEVIDFYSDQVSPRTSHGDLDLVLKPVGLTAAEKADLAAFLRSLTSTGLPENLLRQPRSATLE